MGTERLRQGASRASRQQRWRAATQTGFFLLFLLAPAFDLLRFDLQETQLWFLGMRWSLGIDALRSGSVSATEAGWTLLWRAFIPGLTFLAAFFFVASRYGRLYCGWLCPHFSMVEMFNDLLHRASGRFSLWERSPTELPGRVPRALWWPGFVLGCAVFGFVWTITLLTYLLPPSLVWGGLWQGTLSPNQTRFLVIGTLVLTLEFALARHFFCRFGCAVGLFQSLAWMANPRALLVVFDRSRARECRSCGADTATAGSACDTACPMRLHPRNIKRMMFSCVQCGKCLRDCASTQQAQGRTASLRWHVGQAAVAKTRHPVRPHPGEST